MTKPEKDVVAMQNSRHFAEIAFNSRIFFAAHSQHSSTFPHHFQLQFTLWQGKSDKKCLVYAEPATFNSRDNSQIPSTSSDATSFASTCSAFHVSRQKSVEIAHMPGLFGFRNGPLGRGNVLKFFLGVRRHCRPRFLRYYFNIRFLCVSEYLAKPQVSVPFFPSYSINFHCHSQILYLPFLAG